MDSPGSLCMPRVEDLIGPQVEQTCRAFDFTLLFEESVLTIAPLAVLLPLIPLRLWHLRKNQKVIEACPLHTAKWVSFILLAVLQLALLVLWIISPATKSRTTIPAAVVAFSMSVACCFLSHVEHTRTIRPSSIICLSLLWLLLVDIARTRTLWLLDNNHKVAILFSATTVMKVPMLFLEAWGKTASSKSMSEQRSPEALSGIICHSLFWWLIPLFRLGFKNEIFMHDLPSVDEKLSSYYLLIRLLIKKNISTRGRSSSLLSTLFVSLKWPLLSGIFPRLCLIGFSFCQPILIERTISWISQPVSDKSTNIGYGLMGAFALVYGGIAISTSMTQRSVIRFTAMVRASLVAAIYDGTLKYDIAAIKDSASLSLMSTDIERIENGLQYMHETWGTLIEAGIAIWLIERQLGLGCIAPIAIVTVCTIFTFSMSSKINSAQKLWSDAIQKRIGATAEMLGNIKGIKLSGLENSLAESIQKLRVDEVDSSWSLKMFLIFNAGLSRVTTIMSPILGFAIYILIARRDGTTLDAAKAFTSLSLFTLLSTPVDTLIQNLPSLISAVACFQRIDDYLSTKPRDDYRKSQGLSSSEDVSMPSANCLTDDTTKIDLSSLSASLTKGSIDEKNAVMVKDATFGWVIGEEPILRNINLEVRRSTQTVIIGAVGCGKTTLLHSILGEMPVMCGSVSVSSRQIAYCSQTPWLLNVSIRQNITGVSVLEEQWYNTVLHACLLEEDMQYFPEGDQTMIGSKGITLSGGQKQRIALARAVYSRINLVILDDVTSGIDSATEDMLFNRLFGDHGLFRQYGITVIQVTHSVHRLNSADHIVVLGTDGRVMEQGTYIDLQSTTGYIGSLASLKTDNCIQKEVDSSKVKEKAALSTDTVPETLDKAVHSHSRGIAVYKYYIGTLGWKDSFALLLLAGAFGFCSAFPSYWVQLWTNANAIHPNRKIGMYLGVYSLLGVNTAFFIISASWLMMIKMVKKSAESMHYTLLKTVMSAPISFFATTDSGVTTNSQDMQLIDIQLPLSGLNTLLSFGVVITQAVLMSITTKYMAVSLVVGAGAVYIIQLVYVRTSTQLRLLDLEAKSPLYTQFMESIDGLTTIRAFHWQLQSTVQNCHLLDESTKPFYLLYCAQKWLTLVLNMVIAGMGVLIIGSCIILRSQKDTAYVGVALISLMNLSQTVKILITCWTMFEVAFGAVSRVDSFRSMTDPEEIPGSVQAPPPEWPENGAIEFQNISASYSAISGPALNKVSLSISAGQRIGICGQTGCGKSSFVLTLFRMLNLSSGSIIIDGIDISTVSRKHLRESIIAVPQDPLIFHGSVRFNLDAPHSVSDEDIVRVLKKFLLWNAIESKGGLDTEMSEVFLSQGQSKLLNLARASLRKSTIVVLDEPTSSVDDETDALIQQVIRTEFKHHTIIVVTHRLNTVLDFDKIAVLDHGNLAEYDSPTNLLDRASAFRDMYLHYS